MGIIGCSRHGRAAVARLAVALVGVAVLGLGAPATAQSTPNFGGGGPDEAGPPVVAADGMATATVPLQPVLDGGDQGPPTFVPPVATGVDRTLPRLSDIQVTYDGFGPKSRAAFEYAVTIWERMIRSSVPIKVTATWKPLAPGVLGSAAPFRVVRGSPGAPRSDTYYPTALADARAGRDLTPGQPDIVANFNSAGTWNTSTEGQTEGNPDLVSVVLHELGHGLGIAPSFAVQGGVGVYGVNGLPTSWDRFLADSGGRSLLTGNGTAALASKLQSNAVRFTGAQAVSANGGTVRIYSPSPYEPGSSIGHFDESAFPAGTPNSLMTPYVNQGEAIHDPGDVALGALRDMGWQTTTTRFGKPSAPTIARVSAGNGKIDVAWAKPTSPDRGLIAEYEVTEYLAGSTTPRVTFHLSGTTTSVTAPDLENGQSYRFRVMARNAAGWGAMSSYSSEARPLDLGPFTNVDAFLNRQYLDILWRGPSAASLASRRNAMNTGTDTPGETVVALMGDPTHTASVPPTIRLYLAYFKRLPDEGGLAYWAGKARAGTSLLKASEQFARSSEFTRAYGSLSNGAFVDLVYQNVLGRSPDSGGRSYWVGKLDKGFARGSMMISVSESSENVRKTTKKVNVVALHHVLLRTVPSTSTLDTAVARLDGGVSLPSMATEMLLSKAYRARITGGSAKVVEFRPATLVPDAFASGLEHTDLDKDGLQDLVALGATPGSRRNRVVVALGTPSGLAAPVIDDADFGYDGIASIATGDISGDGRMDVVLALGERLVYLPGVGDGTLGPPITVMSGGTRATHQSVAIGDATGDGWVDIIDVGTDGTFRVHPQLNAGGFAPAVTYSSRLGGLAGIEMTDLNGDSRRDLVMLSRQYYRPDTKTWHDADVRVFLQQSTGSFGTEQTLSPGAETTEAGMVVADFTADGKPDIALGGLGIFKGAGDGTFAFQRHASGFPALAVDGADMDHDGRADLVGLEKESVDVALQRASGNLEAPLTTSTTGGTVYGATSPLTVFDVNGDFKVDVIATDANYRTWLYLQN